MPLAAFPNRMIHLDFHTSPAIPDVGHAFDAESFAETMKQAHVDSVTLFAKCHHGHLYYATDRPERHPGLPDGLDLLGEQIEALHRRNIRAPIYISAQCDEYAAYEHPEWVAVDPDGAKLVGGGPLHAGWHILDMSSPYQEYLAGQFTEVLARFAPADGFFLDMCWDQVSISRWAMDGMRRKGFDPRNPSDRAQYARELTYEYMARFKKMVDDAHAGAPPAGIWFNSRPKTNLHFEQKFVRHIEIESLPTGGWGYAYFPYVARFVRPLGFPTLSHTARFHRTWGDFGGLKPEAALKYECCQMLSQNITRGIGDQLHPRGTLDKAAYDMIGRVYGYVESCEQWVTGGRLLSQIAVIIDPELGDTPGPAGLGLTRVLQELRHQFDLLSTDGDFANYDMVIVPETTPVGEDLAVRLRSYVQSGGRLLMVARAAVSEVGEPVIPELGVVYHGESPFKATYLRVSEILADGIPALDHVEYERGLRFTPAAGAQSLCDVIEPYFERTFEHFCSHGQTPPDKPSRYAAVVHNGNVLTFSFPIFTAYGNHAYPAYRLLLGNAIDLLLPNKIVRDKGPVHLEASVIDNGDRRIVHLLSFCPVRKATDLDIIEDPFPLVSMPISVRLEKRPHRVLLAPSGTEIPFEFSDGYAHVRVSDTTGHVMLVFE